MGFKVFTKVLLVLALMTAGQVSYAEKWQKNRDGFQVKAGLAHDTKTGLIWLRCPLGMRWNGKICSGEPKNYTWKKAGQTAQRFRYKGYKNWRLPSVAELRTLLDVKPDVISQVFSRAECNAAQTEASCFVWSSSLHENRSDFAWVVNIYDSREDYSGKEGNVAVLLVRAER